METSKTYVFNPDGSGNNGGMMSLIAPLLQQRCVDPNVLLAMKGNNGFGNGDGSWFICLLFILCFCGCGGNGFGFGGRGNGAGLANEITMTMVVPCLWMQSVAIVMHSVISLPSSIVQKDRFSKQSLL